MPRTLGPASFGLQFWAPTISVDVALSAPTDRPAQAGPWLEALQPPRRDYRFIVQIQIPEFVPSPMPARAGPWLEVLQPPRRDYSWIVIPQLAAAAIDLITITEASLSLSPQTIAVTDTVVATALGARAGPWLEALQPPRRDYSFKVQTQIQFIDFPLPARVGAWLEALQLPRRDYSFIVQTQIQFISLPPGIGLLGRMLRPARLDYSWRITQQITPLIELVTITEATLSLVGQTIGIVDAEIVTIVSIGLTLSPQIVGVVDSEAIGSVSLSLVGQAIGVVDVEPFASVSLSLVGQAIAEAEAVGIGSVALSLVGRTIAVADNEIFIAVTLSLSGSNITESESVGITAASLTLSGSNITEAESVGIIAVSLTLVGQNITVTDVTDVIVSITSLELAFAPQAIAVIDIEIFAAASLSLVGSDLTIIDQEIVELPPSAGYVLPLPTRLPRVEGRGFGILPKLDGVARGVVYPIGNGIGQLPSVIGYAAGAIGATGSSAHGAVPLFRAAAQGYRGQVGTANAGLEVIGNSSGIAVSHGSGSGTVVKFAGKARGRHDDDDDITTFLLAA